MKLYIKGAVECDFFKFYSEIIKIATRNEKKNRNSKKERKSNNKLEYNKLMRLYRATTNVMMVLICHTSQK